ncbi:putative glyoxalase family protein [Coniella lustricola]|uniref:Putative glyoxalase family protein n=1 Tax=Coniella lustricola TaxID=2025994 RepID=A0A2T3AGM1_9PEZI|nr:putative glyoxalase family protein [Coniella lustricola]
MLTGIHHVNLVVPPNTFPAAHAFYATTLGMTPRAVPVAQKDTLAWFDIGPADSPHPRQQVHIAFGKPEDFSFPSSRHPCFRVASPEDLLALRQRVWDHFQRGGEGAPQAADQPGKEDSGAKGVEYPQRFFARDFAGNRLEFTL